MRFLRASAVALITALVGMFLAVFASDYLTKLYHVSDREGQRGMTVIFLFAPLGIIVGFVVGIVVALCARGQEYFAPLTTKGAPDIVKLQKNPNVTVRMRGVMEKCTFCVQRIEEAKIAAHVRAGGSADTRIPRDSFTTACAQACPTEAIVFGDIKDPESRVSILKKQDRNYRLLEYLNVNTRTSYLARIRNPNPKMPDAANIGVASIDNEQRG